MQTGSAEDDVEVVEAGTEGEEDEEERLLRILEECGKKEQGPSLGEAEAKEAPTREESQEAEWLGSPDTTSP